MRYLLDTHAFLWWILDDPRLSRRAGAIIRDPDNEVLFSAASAWEIAIKAQLGRITFEDDLAELIPHQVAANGFVSLAVTTDHALQVSALPMLHRDPFDRMLVAQAQREKVALLSADPAVAQYAVETLW